MRARGFWSVAVAVLVGGVLVGCGDDHGPTGGDTELSAAECSDGADNDGDGLVDCADVGCRDHSFCGGGGDGGTAAGCGAMTCSGCCDGDTCLGGDAVDACGTGGAACSACSTGMRCNAGSCEATGVSCDASSCSGCCSGTTCLDGTSDSACGSGGGACMDCGATGMCSAGSCRLDPASRWDVVVIDVDVPTNTWDGEAWDGFGGAPDPFVEVRAGSETGTPGYTSTVSDVFSATYDETVLENVRADDLQRYLRFDVHDEDVSAHDWVGACSYEELAESVFGGPAQTLDCPASSTTMASGFDLRFRVERH